MDGQVVRLEQLGDLADRFVRVRLTRIEHLDLSLFEFDYDLTFMVFFMDAEERVYARYGGRDAEGPDTRQSLAGLRYTMQSVLRAHQAAMREFAPRALPAPKYVRRTMGRGCMHCHQVKEALHAELRETGQWRREMVWRYPLPENLGLTLEVDRGNVVRAVADGSPAAAAGLRPGDVLRRLGAVPTRSFADAQLALDRAPATGTVSAVWDRAGAAREGRLALADGWRRTDLSWRASMQHFVPSARLYGTDLTPAQKRALGLPAEQLAFRQKYPLSDQAAAAGVREGDVILGIDGRRSDPDVTAFIGYVRGHYLVGDRVTVQVLRDGQRHEFRMTLR